MCLIFYNVLYGPIVLLFVYDMEFLKYAFPGEICTFYTQQEFFPHIASIACVGDLMMRFLFFFFFLNLGWSLT